MTGTGICFSPFSPRPPSALGIFWYIEALKSSLNFFIRTEKMLCYPQHGIPAAIIS